MNPPDALFAPPRLAEVYDPLESERPDLDHYLALADELGASSVLDVGCGTGCLAVLLAAQGRRVVAIDPAAASVDVARRKAGGESVRWIVGYCAEFPEVDLALMTGNVAQVFRPDDDWTLTLDSIRSALRSGGSIVFETRDPSRAAWTGWTRDQTYRRIDLKDIGVVEYWVDLESVELPFVSFRSNYRFASDGAELVSCSTLRFRERDELAASLEGPGFTISEVRGAPDRPGLEWVFLAKTRGAPA